MVRAFAWHPHTDKFAVALLDDSIKIYNPKRCRNWALKKVNRRAPGNKSMLHICNFKKKMITELYSLTVTWSTNAAGIVQNWVILSRAVLFFVILWQYFHDSFSFCVYSQCHNSHTEAPSPEECSSSAVEAAVCVCPRCRLSKLFTGLARGPLLTVNQVRKSK